MRVLAFLLTLALAAPCPGAGTVPIAATGVKVVRILHGWREAESFKRISDYFDGQENTGGETVLRTQSGQRAGYYFLARLAGPGAALPVRLHLLVVTPDSATPREFDFPTTLPGKEMVCQLGLTGTDWASAKVKPVAWRLEVRDDAGRVLATEQSYLWEKPAGG